MRLVVKADSADDPFIDEVRDLYSRWGRSASSMILERIYALCAAGDPDSALDIVFDEIDDLVDAKRLGDVDQLLDEVDISRMDVPTMLGFLSTTVLVKDELPSRREYVERVQLVLAKSRPPEEVAQTLDSLT